MDRITLPELIQDIHAMDEELWKYESRYGLRTEYFIRLYKAGQLRDEDSAETRDYTDWAACYEIKQQREALYDLLVRKVLEARMNMAKPRQTISLAELRADTARSAYPRI
jgi:hypothetical protein